MADGEYPYQGYGDGPLRDFLKKEYLVKNLEELMMPQLLWEQFINTETVDSDAISYFVEPTTGGGTTRGSASTDIKKRRIPLRAPGSEFAFIEVSELSKESTTTSPLGVAMKFKEALRKGTTGYDPIQRTLNRVARWESEQLNYEAGVAYTYSWTVTNGNTLHATFENITSDPTLARGAGYTAGNTIGGLVDVDKYWGTDDQNPIMDLLDMKEAINNQDGYGFNMDTVIADTHLYGLLVKYLLEVDTKWQREPYGGREALTIPEVGGIKIIEGKWVDGLPNNKILGLDSVAQPCTTYQTFNDEFTRFPKDSRFMTHQFMDNVNHDLITQVWTDRATVNLEPRSVIVLQVTAA